MAGRGEVTIEDARIIFRNFRGLETPFNRAGVRTFCVLLPEPLSEDLDRDGWLIKRTKLRDDGSGNEPYIKVRVGYKGRPPTVVMISSRGRTDLDESTCGLLDHVFIDKVDLMFRPYTWTVGEKSGTAAYVKSIFITIAEDELQLKYADVPYAESDFE